MMSSCEIEKEETMDNGSGLVLRYTSKHDLDFRSLRRLHIMASNKVNYCSGTVSPAGAYEGKLENVKTVLHSYANSGVGKVVVQPKFMGSRATVYLFEDVEKCYSISRNGYRVKLDLTEPYQKLISLFQEEFQSGLEMVVIDAELMPWSSLGENLIVNTFDMIADVADLELDFLESSNFEETLGDFSSVAQQYQQDLLCLSQEELAAKYDNNLISSLRSLVDYEVPYTNVGDMRGYVDSYRAQLLNYTGEAEPWFEPFSICKKVYKSGEEELFLDSSNYDLYARVNPYGKQILVDLSNPEDLNKLYSFMFEMEESGLEGVVIKPEKVYTAGVVPYFKVRNEPYLVLTYGMDYKTPYKYRKLVEQKKVGRKIRQSLYEFELAIEMLRIPYSQISLENKRYELLLLNFLMADIYSRKNIDPRL